MELLGGVPVPAIEFGSRTLGNSGRGDVFAAPQQFPSYASLSAGAASSTSLCVRVYAGKFRNTLVESLSNIVCRVELETIQFRGDSLLCSEGASSPSMASASIQRQRDRVTTGGFASMIVGASPKTATIAPIDEAGGSHDGVYTMWLREVEAVDVLADRIVLISSPGDVNGGDGGRNVTIDCGGDVALATSLGRLIKSRLETSQRLFRIQQQRLVERDEEISRADQAIDRVSGRSIASNHGMKNASSATAREPESGTGRFNPAMDARSFMARSEHLTDNGDSTTQVIPIPVGNHSSSSLPQRNFTLAANSFASLAAALKESDNPAEFENRFRRKVNEYASHSNDRKVEFVQPNQSHNVVGDYFSDDVLNPQGACPLDSLSVRQQQDYIHSAVVAGERVGAASRAAPYSHYPTLRSPYQFHPSPSHPYRALATEKSAAQQLHVTMLNATREAEKRESAARAQVAELSKEIQTMKSEIAVLHTAHSARHGVKSNNLSELLRASNELSQVSSQMGHPSAGKINFDAILEPTIDVRMLLPANGDTSELIAAKKAAAELLLKGDGGLSFMSPAAASAIHRVVSLGGKTPKSHFSDSVNFGEASDNSRSAYNANLARGLAAGGNSASVKRRASIMPDQLMMPTDSGPTAFDSLLSPKETSGLLLGVDGARRTVSHRSDRYNKARGGVLGSNLEGGANNPLSHSGSTSITPQGGSLQQMHHTRTNSSNLASTPSGKQQPTINVEPPSSLHSQGGQTGSRNNLKFLPTRGVFDDEGDSEVALASTRRPTSSMAEQQQAFASMGMDIPVAVDSSPSGAATTADRGGAISGPPPPKSVPPPPPKKAVPPPASGPPPPKGVPPPPKKAVPKPVVAVEQPLPTSPPVAPSGAPQGGPPPPKGVPPPPPKKAAPAPKQPPPEPPTTLTPPTPSVGGAPPPPRGVPPPPPKKAVPKPPVELI